MKPHIICHIYSGTGAIDGEALEACHPGGRVEATAAQLGGDACICGRTTCSGTLRVLSPYLSLNVPPATSYTRRLRREADMVMIPIVHFAPVN